MKRPVTVSDAETGSSGGGGDFGTVLMGWVLITYSSGKADGVMLGGTVEDVKRGHLAWNFPKFSGVYRITGTTLEALLK